MRKRMLVLAAAALALAIAGAAARPASSDGLTNPKHFFWAKGQSDRSGTVMSAASDLIDHGGNAGDGAIGVQTKPAFYLVYWGPQWAKGFTTPDTNGNLYSSRTLQTYVNSFF